MIILILTKLILPRQLAHHPSQKSLVGDDVRMAKSPKLSQAALRWARGRWSVYQRLASRCHTNNSSTPAILVIQLQWWKCNKLDVVPCAAINRFNHQTTSTSRIYQTYMLKDSKRHLSWKNVKTNVKSSAQLPSHGIIASSKATSTPSQEYHHAVKRSYCKNDWHPKTQFHTQQRISARGHC